jgi:hypothetical protein
LMPPGQARMVDTWADYTVLTYSKRS